MGNSGRQTTMFDFPDTAPQADPAREVCPECLQLIEATLDLGFAPILHDCCRNKPMIGTH